MEEVLYTVAQVSKIMKTSHNYVYELIRLGLLPALKLRHLKVRKEALNEFLRRFEGKDLSDLSDIKPLKEGGENE